MFCVLSTLSSNCHIVRVQSVFLLQASKYALEPVRRELIRSFISVAAINPIRFDTITRQKKYGLLLLPATRSFDHGLRQHLISYSSSYFDQLSETKIGDDNDGDGDINLLKSKVDQENIKMIDLLMQYKVVHGDCHIPTGTSKYAHQERERLGVSVHLANWAVKQRNQYRLSNSKKGKISNSLYTRIIILDSIGFMWSCREAQWQRSFNKLELYGKSNGGNLTIKMQDDHQMYTWIEQQRRAYKKNAMSIERENLLGEIDFIFDPTKAKWWTNHESLCRYHQEHGDTMVPLVVDEGNPNYLGQWVARQRRLCHNGTLIECRVKALNDLGFSWDPDAESWDRYYTQLCKFYGENNHTRVPRTMGSLWTWVDRQRRSYRKRLRLKDNGTDSDTDADSTSYGTLITNGNIKKLSNIRFEWENIEDNMPKKIEMQDRMKRLMNVTFELSLHDENWAKNFRKICSFHKKFNHFSVSTDPLEYKELNAWVRHQRYLYNANRLPKNRVELLDSIGFAWTAEIARWDRLYDECVSFYKEHGHTDIPNANSELYRWTKQQKANMLMENPSDQTIAKEWIKIRSDKLEEIILR